MKADGRALRVKALGQFQFPNAPLGLTGHKQYPAQQVVGVGILRLYFHRPSSQGFSLSKAIAAEFGFRQRQHCGYMLGGNLKFLPKLCSRFCILVFSCKQSPQKVMHIRFLTVVGQQPAGIFVRAFEVAE